MPRKPNRICTICGKAIYRRPLQAVAIVSRRGTFLRCKTKSEGPTTRLMYAGGVAEWS